MTRGRHVEIPSRLARLGDKFGAWRKTRSVGERIPDRLWNSAAKLAADYGVNRTATVLSLDYYSLKRRVPDDATRAARATADSVPGSFVELPSISVAPAARPESECVIELADGTGASMRLHMKGIPAADIVAVSRNLWSRE